MINKVFMEKMNRENGILGKWKNNTLTTDKKSSENKNGIGIPHFHIFLFFSPLINF